MFYTQSTSAVISERERDTHTHTHIHKQTKLQKSFSWNLPFPLTRQVLWQRFPVMWRASATAAGCLAKICSWLSPPAVPPALCSASRAAAQHTQGKPSLMITTHTGKAFFNDHTAHTGKALFNDHTGKALFNDHTAHTGKALFNDHNTHRESPL